MRAIPRVAVVALAVSSAASVASAQALGSEFQINTFTTGYQGNFYGGKHSVATDASGNVIVVWHSSGSAGTDSSGTSIQARRFDSSGDPIGDDFQVNTFTPSNQRLPSVAAATTGAFIVTWISHGSSGNDASAESIQARRFDASGNPIGDDFQVNTFTTAYQRSPSVAADAAGGFVVAWTSQGSTGNDASAESIQARRFDASGNPLGDEFQVNTFTPSIQLAPSVAAVATGGFVVAWDSEGSSGNDNIQNSIQARLFDSSGMPIGNDFQVNMFSTFAQRGPSVAADGTGRFVVAWVSYGSSGDDTSDDSIQARRFDSSGNSIGDEFQVNTFTTGNQTSPSIAMGPRGRFVVAWMSDPQDLSNFGVFGQRLAFDEIFADGFE